jgi:hypothetical protein
MKKCSVALYIVGADVLIVLFTVENLKFLTDKTKLLEGLIEF